MVRIKRKNNDAESGKKENSNRLFLIIGLILTAYVIYDISKFSVVNSERKYTPIPVFIKSQLKTNIVFLKQIGGGDPIRPENKISVLKLDNKSYLKPLDYKLVKDLPEELSQINEYLKGKKSGIIFWMIIPDKNSKPIIYLVKA